MVNSIDNVNSDATVICLTIISSKYESFEGIKDVIIALKEIST